MLFLISFAIRKVCSKHWWYVYAFDIRVLVPYWIFLSVDLSHVLFIRPPRSMLSLYWDQIDFSSGRRGFHCHTKENHWPTLALFMGALEPFKAVNSRRTGIHNADIKGTPTGGLRSLPFVSIHMIMSIYKVLHSPRTFDSEVQRCIILLLQHHHYQHCQHDSFTNHLIIKY